MNLTDKPLAAPGLTSYRCKGRHGWIMIGAKDAQDALREAARSTDKVRADTLKVWNGQEYADIDQSRTDTHA